MLPINSCGSGGCASCRGAVPAHDVRQLVRLGVDMKGADYVVAVAGNPNVGKSTVFNALTGLRQHTGNWPGKTVTRAEGAFSYQDSRYKIVDLPGTYSLLATSYDEEIARDFILFGKPDVTLIVADATRLERNLNLVLQVLEITERAVVCLNLVDEARRRGIEVDHEKLAEELGVPVVPTAARSGKGVAELLEAIHGVATGQIACQSRHVGGYSPALEDAVAQLTGPLEAAYPGLPNSRWAALRLLDGDGRITQAVRTGELSELAQDRDEPMELSLGGNEGGAQDAGGSAVAVASPPGVDDILVRASELRWEVGPDFHQALVETIYTEAGRIADRCVSQPDRTGRFDLDRWLDGLLTSPWFGFPLMVLMLAIVLWITIIGANYPSQALAWLLMEQGHPALHAAAAAIGTPAFLSGLLIDGVYLATAWVVSVMLPPMAIFFPLFTLLEDFGYLPRVAFNLDCIFRRCGAHGKQALSMSMGLGCNAAGVIAARVIDSPRERLIAILTNNFSLCNGRWPTQILVATIFLGAVVPIQYAYLRGVVSALAVVTIALLGVAFTFLVSWALSRTVLRGEVSTFSLELPPYRPPRILQTLYTSLIDRTIFVLWRAVLFAVPAGAVIWLVSNIHLGDASVAEHLIGWLNPVGLLIGLNGVILLAYLVAIPANEIVIPAVLMLTVLSLGRTDLGQGPGVMFEGDESATRAILEAGGWTVLTAVNLMLFSLLHNPCSTTIYTIWKETGSVRWTLVSVLVPLAMGVVVCFLVAQVWRVLM